MQIQIGGLEQQIQYLSSKKEQLEYQKATTDQANEDLEKQAKAKEEANEKRLITKLQRDKNPVISQLKDA